LREIESEQNIGYKIDDEDYQFLCKYKWKTNIGGYAYANFNSGSFYMHRMIMDAPKGLEVDHIDGDVTNNQKENLRICTGRNNSCNRKIQGGTSKYKGVYWKKDLEVWEVHINYAPNKVKYLGIFTNEDVAANCYNYWALYYFGEFASRLNDCPFIPVEEWDKHQRGKMTSKYKGVCWVTKDKKWISQIWDGKKNITIGRYDDELEAAQAYINKSKEIYGKDIYFNDVIFKRLEPINNNYDMEVKQ